MPTQHEQLISYISRHSGCSNETIYANYREIFGRASFPQERIRGRLAELRRSGRLIHDSQGWRVPSSSDRTENLYAETSLDRAERRRQSELDEQVRRIATTSRNRSESAIRMRNAGLIVDSPSSRRKRKAKNRILDSERFPSYTCNQRIALIGIEIEGSWEQRNQPEEFHVDTSVHINDGYHVGETRSPPLALDEVEGWIIRYYPDHTNSSCGLHIHVSFTNDLAYMQLMDAKFYKIFINNLKQWAKENNINEGSQLFQRIAGKNRYCHKGYRGDRQSKCTSKESVRYYHLNYCWALQKRGGGIMKTLECRIFPMFKKKDEDDRPVLALKAVEFFYNLCNNYLEKQKPEPKRSSTIDVDFEEEVLEESICV